MNPKGTGLNTTNIEIKREIIGKTQMNSNEMEPHEMNGCTTSKRLQYTDKQDNKETIGGGITLIHQYTQEKATAAQDKIIASIMIKIIVSH